MRQISSIVYVEQIYKKQALPQVLIHTGTATARITLYRSKTESNKYHKENFAFLIIKYELSW